MYLPLEVHGHIYLIFVFAKGESENLSASETRELKKIADAIKREYKFNADRSAYQSESGAYLSSHHSLSGRRILRNSLQSAHELQL